MNERYPELQIKGQTLIIASSDSLHSAYTGQGKQCLWQPAWTHSPDQEDHHLLPPVADHLTFLLAHPGGRTTSCSSLLTLLASGLSSLVRWPDPPGVYLVKYNL